MKQKQRKDINIGFPVNTNLEDFVYHYRALFDAHGIKHNLPITNTEYHKLTNAVPAAQERLLQDFKNTTMQLYQMKNEFGNVEVADMKVAGNTVRISLILG